MRVICKTLDETLRVMKKSGLAWSYGADYYMRMKANLYLDIKHKTADSKTI